MGVLTGSIISGIIGYTLIRVTSKKGIEEETEAKASAH